MTVLYFDSVRPLKKHMHEQLVSVVFTFGPHHGNHGPSTDVDTVQAVDGGASRIDPSFFSNSKLKSS